MQCLIYCDSNRQELKVKIAADLFIPKLWLKVSKRENTFRSSNCSASLSRKLQFPTSKIHYQLRRLPNIKLIICEFSARRNHVFTAQV